MIPKTYDHLLYLDELQGEALYFVQNDTELAEVLENVGFPRRERRNITGAVLLVGDGEYLAVWLTEASRYYDLSSYYHPLPYYRPRSWVKRNLPIYWLEDNTFYQRKEK